MSNEDILETCTLHPSLHMAGRKLSPTALAPITTVEIPIPHHDFQLESFQPA